MSQEMDLTGLEDVATIAPAATEKKPKKEKVVTAEDLAALNSAVEKLKEFGVSEKFATVLPLVIVWHDKEASAPVKDAIIESFGGSDKFKDYVDGEFQKELAVVAGLNKVASVLNNIKSFYARREASKKMKTSQISIADVYYDVNAEFLASIQTLPVDEKREMLLNHEDTKKSVAIEAL